MSLVSNCWGAPEALLREILEAQPLGVEHRRLLHAFYEAIEAEFDGGRWMHGPMDYIDLLQRVLRDLGKSLAETAVYELGKEFHRSIGNAFFRQRPVEHLARRGLRVGLFGRGWESHPRLRAYAGGVLDHGPAVARVVSRTAINLHLTPYALLHTRLTCGFAAGGFFLVNKTPYDVPRAVACDASKQHADELHNLNATDFFPATLLDAISCTSTADLDAKVDYFLSRPDERAQLAQDFRELTLERLSYDPWMRQLIRRAAALVGR